MSSSKQKGNIAPFLLFLTILAIIGIGILAARYILPDGIKTGIYQNPNVATTVIPGSIYDRNGKAISIEVPVYNSDGTVINHTRTYPTTFHACHLVNEAVELLDSYLNPRPGFNEATTYGDDVYLTIDSDIQYILDVYAQDIYYTYKCSDVVAYMANAGTGEILAVSNYPFYDLNSVKSIGINQALPSSITVNNNSKNIFLVSKIVNHNGTVIYSDSEKTTDPFGFATDSELLRKITSEGTMIYELLPSPINPEYVLFIGVSGTDQILEKSQIVTDIVNGLAAQQKI